MLIPRTDSHVWNRGTGLCTFLIWFLASVAVLMKFIVSLLALNTFAALIRRAHSTWRAYIRQFRDYELILLYCHPCTIYMIFRFVVLFVSSSVFLLNINSFSLLSLKSTCWLYSLPFCAVREGHQPNMVEAGAVALLGHTPLMCFS